MKRIFTLLILVVFLIPGYSASIKKLSSTAQISLITCSSGDELYSIFGHSAIRVFDDSMKINEVYNYGTFDFHTPNFYGKFANGELDYMLSAYNFKYFLPLYFRDNRSVSEQVLDLTPTEKQRLFNALEINKLPENKFYRYDFFFDNCATRIRDIIFTSVDGEIIYNNSDTLDMTFRDMIHLYLDKQPWIREGIDVLLGSKIDVKVTQYETMFLPDYLKDYFVKTEVKRDSTTKPLILSDKDLLKFEPTKDNNSYVSPEQYAWLLFILLVLLLLYEIRTKKRFLIIDRLLLFVTGLLGLIVFYLWTFSELTTTGANYNILWAIPTNLILLFKLKHLNKKGFFKTLGIITWASLLLVLIGWKFIPQQLPPVAFPVALIIFIRLRRLIFTKEISK